MISNARLIRSLGWEKRRKGGKGEERRLCRRKENLDDETGMRMSIVPEREKERESLFVFGDIESSINRNSGQLEIEDSTLVPVLD